MISGYKLKVNIKVVDTFFLLLHTVLMKRKITTKKVTEILDDPFYRLESKIRGMFGEQDQKAQEYRDQILTKMDVVMSELENHTIEQEGIKNDIKALKKHFSN